MYNVDRNVFPHWCANEVVIGEVNGRLIVNVELFSRALLGRKKVRIALLLPSDFERLDPLFPGAHWDLSNGYVAILTTNKWGKRIKIYVGQALVYLHAKCAWRLGQPSPSTEGLCCRYGPGGVLDLTPENLRAGTASKRHRSSTSDIGSTLDWRQQMLAEGNDPDTLAAPRGPKLRKPKEGSRDE